jgi:hypothetical protein
MYHHAISVDTCVTIREACPVEYIISGQYVEFSYGSLQKGFHFSFEPAALRKLLMLGAEALAEMTRVEQELAEDGVTGELVTAGEAWR